MFNEDANNPIEMLPYNQDELCSLNNTTRSKRVIPCTLIGHLCNISDENDHNAESPLTSTSTVRATLHPGLISHALRQAVLGDTKLYRSLEHLPLWTFTNHLPPSKRTIDSDRPKNEYKRLSTTQLWICFKLMCLGHILPSSVVLYLLCLIRDEMANDNISYRLARMCLTLVFKLQPIEILSSGDYLRQIRSFLSQQPDPFKTSNRDLVQTCDTSGSIGQVTTRKPYFVPELVTEILSAVQHAVDCGNTVLLEGPSACGKTLALEYLAAQNGMPVVKLQMSDGVDLRELMGSYQCDCDSSFKWVPGILSKASVMPCWLLIEDVDSCPMDVLCFICSMLNNRKFVQLCTGLEINVHCQFRAFLTHRIKQSRPQKSSQRMFLESSLRDFHCISMRQLSNDEIRKVCRCLFSSLHSMLDRVVDNFLFVKEVSDSVFKRSTHYRHLSTRDLIRVLNRVMHSDLRFDDGKCSFNVICMVCHHCTDCWISWMQPCEHQRELCQKLTSRFLINPERLEQSNDDLLRKQLQLQLQTTGPVNSNFCPTEKISRLLGSLVRSCDHVESVLLCGETGVGKTTIVQFIAELRGKKLTIVNVNAQTEVLDLLGGYRPCDMAKAVRQLWRRFIPLFYGLFDKVKNETFMHALKRYYQRAEWPQLLACLEVPVIEAAARATDSADVRAWTLLQQECARLRSALRNGKISFEYVEGPLARAYRHGCWLLLDEVNLASSETLLALASVLERDPIIGANQKAIDCHPDFRLFACMNPSFSDGQKRELPVGLRSRFTEFFVEETKSKTDLMLIAEQYLKSKQHCASVVDLYLELRTNFAETSLLNCNFRSFCRALIYAKALLSRHFLRSLYEGFVASFASSVSDPATRDQIIKCITTHLIHATGQRMSVLTQPLLRPTNEFDYEKVSGFWIARGLEESCLDDRSHIFTATVNRQLEIVSRLLSIRQFPILLQGETSVGKTSLIKWLARKTGNTLIIINNHEHTDVQEYVGSYSAELDPSSLKQSLKFHLGSMSVAMKNGHWLLLDEFNLAPSQVLEAFNRVLDDNRELFIPELNEMIKAHPKFAIFATQNPSDMGYAGRKPLSRALRSRFAEVNFTPLPPAELQEILTKKQEVPPSYAQKMVAVLQDLQNHRSSSFLFRGKTGLMTLRDLFRWSHRFGRARDLIADSVDLDWQQLMVDMGFLLIGSRTRCSADTLIIKQTIERAFKRSIDERSLFDLTSPSVSSLIDKRLLLECAENHVIMTSKMQRMIILLELCYIFDEPALLTGNTGCGKTTSCRFLARLHNKELTCVNCHLHSEASDFIGSTRCIGNGHFKWVDGPLVKSMRDGSVFMLDEISLAEHSVLERLNSVLDPERTVRLTDMGSHSGCEQTIVASAEFRFVSTMNPGGDYGKKELSPALRNRFTELWCPSDVESDEMDQFCRSLIGEWPDLHPPICKFVNSSLALGYLITIRDVTAWFSFIQCTLLPDHRARCVHGAFLTFHAPNRFDGIVELATTDLGLNVNDFLQASQPQFIMNDSGTCQYGVDPFFINVVGDVNHVSCTDFIPSPTSCKNLMKILRALQLVKPILLEGDPALGKTSMVQFLAKVTGHDHIRINLSDQTDVSDLFGCNLPRGQGCFEWSDGPLLRALKAGSWVILDELNLASQSVLEALNACLDFRSLIYVPELDKTFNIDHRHTRIFATQNPHGHAGRKGLPKSFINRFSTVLFDNYVDRDVYEICHHKFPSLSVDCIQNLISLNGELSVVDLDGNLRDMLRWCQISVEATIHRATTLVFYARAKSNSERAAIEQSFANIFHLDLKRCSRRLIIDSDSVYLGLGLRIHRGALRVHRSEGMRLKLYPEAIERVQMLCGAAEHGFSVLLSGPPKSGKRSSVELLAALSGHALSKISLSNSSDAADILGSFEQVTETYEQISMRLQKLVSMLVHVNWAAAAAVYEVAMEIRETRYDRWSIKSKINEIQNSLAGDPECVDVADEMRNILGTLQAGNQPGHFVWRDSVLVNAVREGCWVMIENIGLCSAAVTDRLNALLEPNGQLLIVERGQCDNGGLYSVPVHPDFRLFCINNLGHGAISSAFRNRMVEIFYDCINCVNVNVEDPHLSSGRKCLNSLPIGQYLCWPPLAALRQSWFIFDNNFMDDLRYASIVLSCERSTPYALECLSNPVISKCLIGDASSIFSVVERELRPVSGSLHRCMFPDIFGDLVNVHDHTFNNVMLMIRFIVYGRGLDPNVTIRCRVVAALLQDGLQYMSLMKAVNLLYDCSLNGQQNADPRRYDYFQLLKWTTLCADLSPQSTLRTIEQIQEIQDKHILVDLTKYESTIESDPCYNPSEWRSPDWRRNERLRMLLVSPSNKKHARACLDLFRTPNALDGSPMMILEALERRLVTSLPDSDWSQYYLLLAIPCLHQACIASGHSDASIRLPGYKVLQDVAFHEGDTFHTAICEFGFLLRFYLLSVSSDASVNPRFLLENKLQEQYLFHHELLRNCFLLVLICRRTFLRDVEMAGLIRFTCMTYLRTICSERKLKQMQPAIDTIEGCNSILNRVPPVDFDPSIFASHVISTTQEKLILIHNEIDVRSKVLAVENGMHMSIDDHPWAKLQSNLIELLRAEIDFYTSRMFRDNKTSDEYQTLRDKLCRFVDSLPVDGRPLDSLFESSFLFCYELRNEFPQFPDIVVPFTCAVSRLFSSVQRSTVDVLSSTLKNGTWTYKLFAFPQMRQAAVQMLEASPSLITSSSIATDLMIELLKITRYDGRSAKAGLNQLVNAIYDKWKTEASSSFDYVTYHYKENSSMVFDIQRDFLSGYSDIVPSIQPSMVSDSQPAEDGHLYADNVINLFNLAHDVLENKEASLDVEKLIKLKINLAQESSACVDIEELMFVHLWLTELNCNRDSQKTEMIPEELLTLEKAGLALNNAKIVNTNFELPILNVKNDVNFYRASNEREVSRLLPILESLKKTINQRLEDIFSDHPVLLQLLKIIDRLMSTFVDLPLARFLCGVDILTGIIQNDWEKNVPKQYSFRDHLDTLTKLTVEWRRAEVRCWATLVHIEEQQITNDIILDTFMPILHILKRVKNNPSYLTRGGMQCIERYLFDSTLGDCGIRANILRTVLNCVDLKDDTCGTLIRNVIDKFACVCDPLNQILNDECQHIYKHIKDTVELARWSDLNYYTALDSCHKNKQILRVQMTRHRSLYCQSIRDKLKPELLKCPDTIAEPTADLKDLLIAGNLSDMRILSILKSVKGRIAEIKSAFSEKPDALSREKEARLKDFKHIVSKRSGLIVEVLNEIRDLGLIFTKRANVLDMPQLESVCSLPYRIEELSWDNDWWADSRDLFWRCWSKFDFLLAHKCHKDVSDTLVRKACVAITGLLECNMQWREIVRDFLEATTAKSSFTAPSDVFLDVDAIPLETSVLNAALDANTECPGGFANPRKRHAPFDAPAALECCSLVGLMLTGSSVSPDRKAGVYSSRSCSLSCSSAIAMMSVEVGRHVAWLCLALADFLHLVWTQGLSFGIEDLTESEVEEMMKDATSAAGFDDIDKTDTLSGAKDVSEQIEYEDQIEGIKGDDDCDRDVDTGDQTNKSDNDSADEDTNKGVEMSEDFNGNLESQNKENNEDDPDNTEKSDNIDENMGSDVEGDDRPYTDQILQNEDDKEQEKPPSCEEKGCNEEYSDEMVAQEGDQWTSDDGNEPDVDSIDRDDREDDLFNDDRISLSGDSDACSDVDIKHDLEEENAEGGENVDGGEDASDNLDETDGSVDGDDKNCETDGITLGCDGSREQTTSKPDNNVGLNRQESSLEEKNDEESAGGKENQTMGEDNQESAGNFMKGHVSDGHTQSEDVEGQFSSKDYDESQKGTTVLSMACDRPINDVPKSNERDMDKENKVCEPLDITKHSVVNQCIDNTSEKPRTFNHEDVGVEPASANTLNSDWQITNQHADRKDLVTTEPVVEEVVFPVDEWRDSLNRTHQLSNELCERFRAILAPTKAAGYSGFYRTGRRLSIKRVLAFVASDYRNDRIWLRRQKQVNHDLQIMLAIDNSHSMQRVQNVVPDCLTSLIAAIRLLGCSSNTVMLGVCSFGQECEVLRPLNTSCASFSDTCDGPEILRGIRFNESATNYIAMLESARRQFESLECSAYRLLMVLSDGFVTGQQDQIAHDIRALIDELNVFVVIIVIDDSNPQKSLASIKEAIFKPDGTVEFKPVLSDFPFPFYVLVNEATQLPYILTDALCQWVTLLNEICRG